MSAEQHLGVMQPGEFFVVDGDEAHLFQTFAFLSVVHNVSQAIERGALCQFLFCFFDGGGYAEAEARTFVYLYINHWLLFGIVLPAIVSVRQWSCGCCPTK